MFCQTCGNANAPTSKFCTSCGQGLAAVAPATDMPVGDDPYKPVGMSHAEYAYDNLPPVRKAGLSRGALIGIIAGVLVVAGVLTAAGVTLANNARNAASSSSQDSSSDNLDYSTDNGDSSSDYGTDTYDPNWPPAGYTDWDGSVAYKWTTSTTDSDCSDCTYSTMDVTSLYGCDSLYVEVNFTDSTDSVVDWSNDTASYLSAGQTAKLEFDTYEDNADHTTVTEISCY
ncbi:MAG: zinc ribbon domain-containing protein [Actinomycetales bacterium]|nr:zinc ribbon domain-containing protein [Actinomycetales bacterium]